VHVPLALAPSADEQASQAPEQAVLQQTLSTQNPDVHWSFAEQLDEVVSLATHACDALQ
jgi:hypothetical protein